MISAVSGQGEEIVRAILIRILKIVYGDRRAVPWRLLPVAQRVGLIQPGEIPRAAPDEHVAITRDRDHAKRLGPVYGPFAYILDTDRHVTATFLPEALCSHQTSIRQAAIDNLLPQDFCPKTPNTQASLEQAADKIRADEVDVWVPAVSKILDQVQEDFLLNMAGFVQAQELRHDDACSKCWTHLIRPTAESLLSIDCDGWNLLPVGGKTDDGLMRMLSQVGTLDELLTIYDESAGHLTLSPPHSLGTHFQEFIKRCGVKDDAWPGLQEWLFDERRPWRQYHACEALLSNIELVPQDKQAVFWDRVVDIAELCCAHKIESNEAQVWRLEAELAANYLRTIDLGGYGLEANRPLTTSWWAARKVTQLLTSKLPSTNIADGIRQWRSDPILQGALLTHEAWAWLSPKTYSPARFATLNEITPRPIALLLALGLFVRSIGVESIPASVRERLRDCFCAALVIGDTAVVAGEQGLWMWEYSLVEAAQTFFSALPEDEQNDLAAQAVEYIEGLADPAALKKALERLATTT